MGRTTPNDGALGVVQELGSCFRAKIESDKEMTLAVLGLLAPLVSAVEPLIGAAAALSHARAEALEIDNAERRKVSVDLEDRLDELNSLFRSAGRTAEESEAKPKSPPRKRRAPRKAKG